MNSSFLNVLITVVAAVISGVIVRFIGDLWKERYLDPIHSFKVLRGKIDSALVFYKNKYTVLIDEKTMTDDDRKMYFEVSQNIRALACDLVSSTSELPDNRQDLPSNYRIREASQGLIGLSNNIPCVKKEGVDMSKQNRALEEEIRISLHLRRN